MKAITDLSGVCRRKQQNVYGGLCNNNNNNNNNNNKTPLPESASELYRPRDRRLSAKLVPTLADRGCHVDSVTDPYGSILDFLDRSRYFFFQVAPQLYSRGWVDPGLCNNINNNSINNHIYN
jgi:hypothetical protein